jgi:hypothetical protein
MYLVLVLRAGAFGAIRYERAVRALHAYIGNAINTQRGGVHGLGVLLSGETPPQYEGEDGHEHKDEDSNPTSRDGLVIWTRLVTRRS